MNSLEGKVAGLSIASSGAGVGSDVRVVLRGNRSIDGDSQPLYIVDGVPSGGVAELSIDNIASINVFKRRQCIGALRKRCTKRRNHN